MASDIKVEAGQVSPGGTFQVQGEGFGELVECDDAGFVGEEPEGAQFEPRTGIAVELRQGSETWQLPSVDANWEFTFRKRLSLPEDAASGRATVTADGNQGIVEASISVVKTGEESSGQASEQGTGVDQKSTSDQEPATVVATGCSAETPPVDLIAKGTVEEVIVRKESSLVKVRGDQVLKGDAENRLVIKTQTGSQAVTSTDVQFEEGADYLLRLNRRGRIYTTNTCLGTKPLSSTTRGVEETTGLEGAFAQPAGEPPVIPPNFVLERDGTVIIEGDSVTNCRSLGVGFEREGHDSEIYQRQARRVLERCEQLDLSSGGDLKTGDSEVVVEITGAGIYPG